MADYGAVAAPWIALTGLRHSYSLPRPMHADLAEYPSVFHVMLRRDGTFAGNVKTAGVNEPHVDVFIMWRPSGALVARTRTDANGNWSLTGFDPDRATSYAIIYKDPETGSVYNDAIYSLAAPVE